MKLVLSVACLACLASVIYGFCETADDCNPNECCVAESSYDLVREGWCVPLGRRGMPCNKPESRIDYYGGKFVHECPCAEGLVCSLRGDKVSDFQDDHKLRCRRPATTGSPDIGTREITSTHKEITPTYEEITETLAEVTEIETLVTEDVPNGPGGERPRDDDCENWEYPC